MDDNVAGSVSLADVKTEGFKRAWLVQGGNKLNCLGCGTVSFAVNKKANLGEQAEIVFEASSREALAKDIESKDDRTSRNDLDLVRGHSEERGINPNSFYMTDDDKYESRIEVYADDIKLGEFVLEDDPADSSGALSWHYQVVDNKLDEAGSYGYLCRVKIDKDVLSALLDSFDIRIKADRGISIFGRKSWDFFRGT